MYAPIKNTVYFVCLMFLGLPAVYAQEDDAISYAGEQLEYSSMDSWYFREIKESNILGGDTKKLYELGANPNTGESLSESNSHEVSSPWKTSNTVAKLGVNIANNCVFPEENQGGYCCRMETKIRNVNVLGLNLNVLIAGALFLGEIDEPVKNIKYPIKILNHGIPFTEKPKGIRFDYKYHAGDERVNSFRKSIPVEGKDKAEVCLILQKRWEDEDGNVFATRIGATRQFLDDTNGNWINDTTLEIKYGDISKESYYNPKTMGLIPATHELYVKNSKGEMVSLIETDWDRDNSAPTHLVLYCTSSYEGVDYIGSPESVFWIDNIELEY